MGTNRWNVASRTLRRARRAVEIPALGGGDVPRRGPVVCSVPSVAPWPGFTFIVWVDESLDDGY